MSADGFDQALTVFSPEGRLYQVEYAFRAVRTSGLSHLAIRCTDGVVLVSQLPSTDRLVDVTNSTFIHPISGSTVCMVCGRIADGRRVVDRVRSEAIDFFRKWDYHPTADIICERLADINQVYTQEAWQRPFGNVAIFAGWDEERGCPLLYRTDPAGTCVGYFSTAAGAKETELVDALATLQRTWKGPCPSVQDGIRTALRQVQRTLHTGITADDVEVAVVERTGFRRLVATEIDQLLADLAVGPE